MGLENLDIKELMAIRNKLNKLIDDKILQMINDKKSYKEIITITGCSKNKISGVKSRHERTQE